MYVIKKDIIKAIKGLKEIIGDDQIRTEYKETSKTWLIIYQRKLKQLNKKRNGKNK